MAAGLLRVSASSLRAWCARPDWPFGDPPWVRSVIPRIRAWRRATMQRPGGQAVGGAVLSLMLARCAKVSAELHALGGDYMHRGELQRGAAARLAAVVGAVDAIDLAGPGAGTELESRLRAAVDAGLTVLAESKRLPAVDARRRAALEARFGVMLPAPGPTDSAGDPNGMDDTQPTTLAAARERLRLLRAAKLRLETGILEGRLLPRSAARAGLLGIVHRVAAALRGLPARLAAVGFDGSDPVASVRTELDRVLADAASRYAAITDRVLRRSRRAPPAADAEPRPRRRRAERGA